MYIRKIAWSSDSYQPVEQPKPNRVLLLPWCTAITGYLTRRKTNYNQWLVTDKQETHYRVRVSQVERKAPQMEDTHDNSSTYVNAILIVLCMSNGLICVYIIGIHDKRIVTSCTTWHFPQTIGVFRVNYPSIILQQYMPLISYNLRYICDQIHEKGSIINT